MHVEIWSDIACPWCYIGKRRFDAALEEFEHRDEVRVVWRAFELDPSSPRERPGDRNAHLARKYGTSLEQARAMHDHLTQEAAGDGLELRFDQARLANTFDAHRLVRLAAEHGCQAVMKERLLSAHFTEGLLVSDPTTLRLLAAQVGLPDDRVAELLDGDRFSDEVRAEEQAAAALGITAVPFFVVDRRLGAAGAHPPDTLLELLRRGWAQADGQA